MWAWVRFAIALVPYWILAKIEFITWGISDWCETARFHIERWVDWE